MIDYLFDFNSPVLWGIITSIFFLVLVIFLFKWYLLPLTRNLLKLKDELELEKKDKEITIQKVRSAVFLETIEKERKRISTDLHDMLLPVLYAAKFNMENIKEKKNIESRLMDDTISSLADASDDLKNIIYELTPVELDVVDLEQGLSKIINNYTKKHNLNIEVQTYSIPPDIEKETALVIYRAVKELLQNVKKHAKAEHVSLSVYDEENKIIIEIIDDGIGFDFKHFELGKGLGYGLSNILANVEKLDGKIEINFAGEDKGTKVYIELPLS